jgi:hypothetical protein
VTSPDDRADGSARNAAIKLVEDALKSGRIVQADHDMRVDQLRGAQTMQDVDLQVRDLRAAPPTSPATVAPVPPTPTGRSAASAEQAWPPVNYGPGSASSGAAELASAVSKGGKAIGGIIAVVVLVSVIVPIAGVVIAFFAARDSFPDLGSVGPTDETTYAPGEAPGKNGVNVHTVEGYEDMVAALREETGQTYTFTTVIYPRYAVLDVPTGVNERYEAFYWDGGSLTKNSSRGSSGDDQVDLSLVDPEQLIEMLKTVRGRLDSPDSWYVVISDYELQDAQISAYASNDFGETTYLIESLDGTVIYDSEAAPGAGPAAPSSSSSP